MFLVCIDVRIVKQRWLNHGITWNFGSCKASSEYKWTEYGRGKLNRKHVITERCCVEGLENNLLCGVLNVESTHQGWADDYMEIQGHQYCNDFVGYNAMRKVKIKGICRFNFANR